MGKYPIEHKPTAAFLERLKVEASPDWIVEDLRFIEYAQNKWGASWTWGAHASDLRMEMTVGGIQRELADIETRVLNALKPGGKI